MLLFDNEWYVVIIEHGLKGLDMQMKEGCAHITDYKSTEINANVIK